MGVKKGHVWDNLDNWGAFLHMIYPKGDFVELGGYLLFIYRQEHRQYEQNQCFVHPAKESV